MPARRATALPSALCPALRRQRPRRAALPSAGASAGVHARWPVRMENVGIGQWPV